MLKVLQVRIQEQGSCRFKKTNFIDWEEDSTDQTTILQILISAHQPIKPSKWLGFQIYFSHYIKETLSHGFGIVESERLECLLCLLLYFRVLYPKAL